MPSPKEKSQQAPDTARTYERARPADEKGQGVMADVRNTPVTRPDDPWSSVNNNPADMEMTADDIIDADASVDPTGGAA
ncbi:MAG: hypothetical protein AAF656_09320 [Planctomycetota bacterium]